MIFIFSIYFLFLLIWALLSYLVAKQLIAYGFVGDATRSMTRAYFVISGAIILFSIIAIIAT